MSSRLLLGSQQLPNSLACSGVISEHPDNRQLDVDRLLFAHKISLYSQQHCRWLLLLLLLLHDRQILPCHFTPWRCLLLSCRLLQQTLLQFCVLNYRLKQGDRYFSLYENHIGLVSLRLVESILGL